MRICRSCCNCGKITIGVNACNGFGQNGATVTLKLGATTIGVQTTGAPVVSITRTAAGAGYTSAPTVAIGAPPAGGVQATATVSISGGGLQTFAITNQGSGYTSAPSVTITGGGGGGGSGTANLGGYGQAIFAIAATGTYTASVTTGGLPGWWTAPADQNIVVTNCATGGSKGFNLVPAAGYFCACVCSDPMPIDPVVTDSNGTFAMGDATTSCGFFGVSHWTSCYTLAGTVWSDPLCGTSGPGSIAVSYVLFCPAPNNFRLIQYWSYCGGVKAGAGTCAGNSLIPGFAIGCAASNTAVATPATSPANCNDTISFTITGGYVNGTVTVSF